MMAWGTPLTAVSNAALTAAQWNASVRDNLLETAPAKASNAGSHFIVTGANTIAERTVAHASVIASESTASTSYVDLGTTGPAVTLTATARAVVLLSAYLANNTVNSAALMSVDISGAATQAATNSFAVRHTSATANALVQCSFASATAVTAGSSTYTAKYAASANTANFDNRRITVMPF